MSSVELPTDPNHLVTTDLSVLIQPQPLRAGSAAGVSAEQAQAVKAAKDFESVLLYKLLEEMKRTIPESGLLDSGITRQIQGIFWFYLAQDVAGKGGIGLWKDLYQQMNLSAGLTPPTPSPTELPEQPK